MYISPTVRAQSNSLSNGLHHYSILHNRALYYGNDCIIIQYPAQPVLFTMATMTSTFLPRYSVLGHRLASQLASELVQCAYTCIRVLELAAITYFLLQMEMTSALFCEWRWHPKLSAHQK